MGKRVRIFLNQKSGGGAGEDAASLAASFARHGCESAISHLSAELDLAALARSEPQDVAFIAAGGDGTVNCVARAVANTSRRMGVLPVGTLNHFAKDLGLPPDLEAAVAVAAGDTARSVDAGEVNGRIFVNNSSLGAYPAMVLERERMKRTGWNRWLSLVVASVRSFIHFRRMNVEVQVNGAPVRRRTPFIFIGNNEYCLQGSRIARRERLDGGKLSVYLAHGIGRAGTLRMALAALLGRVRQVPEYEELLVDQLTITVRRRRSRVSLDGEVKLLASPLRYRILPGALCVLCPAPQAPPDHP